MEKLIKKASTSLRTSVACILLFLALFSESIADGPPIDSIGNIYGDYIAFWLDSTQMETINRFRIIEFNKTQKRVLKKLNPKADINVWQVITFPYQDCTCGMMPYAIWNRADYIGIPLDFILEYNDYLSDYIDDNDIKEFKGRKKFKPVIPKLEDALYNFSEWYLAIYMDLNFRYYYLGVELQKSEVFTLIDNFASAQIKKRAYSSNSKCFGLYAPPFVSKEIKEKSIEIAMEIKKYCEKKGISFFSLFDRDLPVDDK